MSGESLWSSPLVLAILAAAVGLIGNVGVTWLNSSEQRKLEQERALFNDKLESSKSEAARILEVIKTDPEKAANNLKFLIETGLVSDRNIQKSVTEYLAKNPGKGPSLPSSLPTGPIEIDPQFKTIYGAAPQLGKPRLPAELADDAYQAVYDGANVIWIKSLYTIYVLPHDHIKEKLKREADTDYAKDPNLFEDEWLKTKFGDVPNDKYPPHGGVAYFWLKDPKNWDWIGWRLWYCRFFNQIRYQYFDNGIALGIFHENPRTNRGNIFVVLDDNSWLVRHAVDTDAPICIQNPYGPRANDSGPDQNPIP